MDRRILFLILAVFTVSWAAILIKLCSAPPLVIAFYRMFIASVILCPLVFLKHFSALKQLLAEAPKLAILSGIFLGLHFAFWVTSLFYTSVSSSVVIVATQPVFVALFSFLNVFGFFKNKLGNLFLSPALKKFCLVFFVGIIPTLIGHSLYNW